MPNGWCQALVSSTQQLNEHEVAQTGIQEVPHEHKKNLYFESERSWEGSAQRGSGILFSGDIQDAPGFFPAGNLL